MAEPQRDLTAEQAAQRLRASTDVHYLDASVGPDADNVSGTEGVDPTNNAA